jgi:hypothetical protein
MNATRTTDRVRKRESERVIRRNICLPPELDRRSGAVLAKFGFSSFSDYVQARLRKDSGLELP